MPTSLVSVLSLSGSDNGSVHPAQARKLIKLGKATLVSRQPYVTIRLSSGESLDSLLQLLDVEARERKESKLPTFESQYNAAQDMIDVSAFFDKVDRKNGGDGLVWVRARLKGGMQLVVSIRGQNGQRFKVPPIKPGDPICLNRFGVPFEVLKDSGWVMTNASRGNLKLLTTEQAKSYFAEKAALLKTDIDTIMAQADAEARKEVSGRTGGVDTSQRIKNEYVAEEDLISPRVQYLLGEVDVRLKDEQKMPASELLKSLFELEESLTLDEFEVVRAKGYWPSVKSWADKHIAGHYKQASAESDDLSDV